MGKKKQGDVNAPVKRRPGPATPELRKALELVFLGQDGVLLSVRGAANKVISVNRTFLQTTVDVIADELRRKRFVGYEKPKGARRINYPVPAEGSNLRNYLQRRISTYEISPNPGAFKTFLTPDEEKLLVGIIEMRDFYGFGLGRSQVCGIAMSWYKKLPYRRVVCSRKWFYGFMRRAKIYKPGFGGK